MFSRSQMLRQGTRQSSFLSSSASFLSLSSRFSSPEMIFASRLFSSSFSPRPLSPVSSSLLALSFLSPSSSVPLSSSSLSSSSASSSSSFSHAESARAYSETARDRSPPCAFASQGGGFPTLAAAFLRRFASSSSPSPRKKGECIVADEADEVAESLLSSVSSSPSSPSSSAWLLDTGEIVPGAFASVKKVGDFPLLPLSLLLSRLKERRQELLRDWQVHAVRQAAVREPLAEATRENDGGAGPRAVEAFAREEERIQRKIKILELLACGGLEENASSQGAIGDAKRIAFLAHADAVNLLLLLAAEAETLARPGEREETEGKEGSSAVGEISKQEERQLWRLKCEGNEEKWNLCISRLKELALDHEDSFLVFYAMCSTNRFDAVLLPALLERLEASFFSSQALSKPLFHPIFEVWDPPCESFAALINVLPLSAKAVVVTADRRSERERRENEGWLAPPEAPPLVLPNWQTMHPVDMEAWEKKQRRVVRTRHVKAKIIRQADGRKLAATMALHGRQAIHRDAAVSSLVSVAAMCASNSQRALRGELLPETLNLLAAELLGRSADALSPHLLSLSFLLSQSSVSLTERLFLHLEAVLRGWLEENGFVEKKQTENVDGESKELCTETASEKRRKASEEQLRNLPPGLNVFGLVQSSPSSSDALLASGERSETSKSADTESALWESRVLAALLSSFLRVDDYRPSLDFVLLLSDALRNSLRRTAVLSSASESSAPLAIHEKDVLSLKETGALLSSFATSGYAVPPSLMACLVEHFLYDVDLFLTSSPLSPFASSPSSSSSSAEEAEQLSQSFFCSSRGRATPGDCATLLHSLASPSPLSSERLAAADKAGEQKTANLEKLRFEAMTQAWRLVAPVLHLLQPPCKLLILNSLQTAHAPPDVSSTAFFQRSLETFLRDNPDVDSSLLGSLFGTQGRQ